MAGSSTVVSLRLPDVVDDPLTAVLRSGAQWLLAPGHRSRSRRVPCHDEERATAGTRCSPSFTCAACRWATFRRCLGRCWERRAEPVGVGHRAAAGRVGHRLCALAAARPVLGFQVGMRESAQSWRKLLVDPKARGLAIAPELAIGNGAPGFWKAFEEVSSSTQRWVASVKVVEIGC